MKRFFALLLAAMLLAGCAVAEEETEAAVNYVTEADMIEEVTYDTTEFVCEVGGFKVNVPTGWEFVDGLEMPENAEAGAVKSFTALCSPEGDKSLSFVVASSGNAGIEDISTDVDKLTDEVIGRMRNVTKAENNGLVTSGNYVYMYVGYIIDENTTVDQYFRLVGDDLIMVTFLNESDNGMKGAVLSTLTAIE